MEKGTRINKLKNFDKIRIENVQYYRKEDGSLIFTSWTGFGKILVNFFGYLTIKRNERKPIYTMIHKNRLFQIDIREKLKEHLKKIEEQEFSEENKPGEQMEIKFENFKRKF